MTGLLLHNGDKGESTWAPSYPSGNLLVLPCSTDQVHAATQAWRGFSSVQSLSRVWLCNPWITARQASLSITNSQNLLKLMPIDGGHDATDAGWWCHPAISSSDIPFFSCPQYLPASGYFQMNQPFTWGGQSIEVSASASVLPMNTQY